MRFRWSFARSVTSDRDSVGKLRPEGEESYLSSPFGFCGVAISPAACNDAGLAIFGKKSGPGLNWPFSLFVNTLATNWT
jgi:hypothetical protein